MPFVVPPPGSRPPLTQEGLEAVAPSRPTEGSAPAEAAPATGPVASLWEVLTPEERAFFLQQQALGSLTYRPNGDPGGRTSLPTGQRIDTRG
jgi:hypothetical protein